MIVIKHGSKKIKISYLYAILDVLLIYLLYLNVVRKISRIGKYYGLSIFKNPKIRFSMTELLKKKTENMLGESLCIHTTRHNTGL